MRDPWMPEREPGGDELNDLLGRERESWRGEVHRNEDAWRGDDDDESWRGEEHLAEWPEHAAGPEYWMFKAAADA